MRLQKLPESCSVPRTPAPLLASPSPEHLPVTAASGGTWLARSNSHFFSYLWLTLPALFLPQQSPCLGSSWACPCHCPNCSLVSEKLRWWELDLVDLSTQAQSLLILRLLLIWCDWYLSVCHSSVKMETRAICILGHRSIYHRAIPRACNLYFVHVRFLLPLLWPFPPDKILWKEA